jgi:hypothetical protein
MLVLVVLAVELVEPPAPVVDDVLDVVVGPPVVGDFESSEEQAATATTTPEPIAKVRSRFFTGFSLRQTIQRSEAEKPISGSGGPWLTGGAFSQSGRPLRNGRRPPFNRLG